MEVGYRTERFSGLMERDAVDVITFETHDLMNTDIPETLCAGVLATHPICEELRELITAIEDGGDISTCEVRQIYTKALEAIKEVTGHDVRYVLWLADKETVERFYWPMACGVYNNTSTCPKMEEGDYDIYPVGPVIISDLGAEGRLYGYEECPQPITQN